MLLFGLRFDEIGEAVGAPLPDGALFGEPAFGGAEPIGVDVAGAHPPALFGPNEPRALEHREMFEECWEPDAERFGEPLHRRRAGQQPLDDGAPRRIGERVEKAVERLLVHHLEKYSNSFPDGKLNRLRKKRAAPKSDP